MRKILVIDNNIDPPHGCADIVRSLREADAQKRFTLEVHRGPEEQYPKDPRSLAAVVISGSKTSALDTSPWVKAQLNFLERLQDVAVPTFGICYGQQLMAKAFGGESYVRKAPVAEFGFVELRKTSLGQKSALLQNLPKSFYSFCYHYDEVEKVPPGFANLLSSEACAVHMIGHEERPMWGVQFHPERDVAESQMSLRKITQQDPDVQPLGLGREQELYDPQVAQILFTNFLNLAVEIGERK